MLGATALHIATLNDYTQSAELYTLNRTNASPLYASVQKLAFAMIIHRLNNRYLYFAVTERELYLAKFHVCFCIANAEANFTYDRAA